MSELIGEQANAITVMVNEGRVCYPVGVGDHEFHNWLDSVEFKRALLNTMVMDKLVKLINSDDEEVALTACEFVQERYLNEYIR